MRDKRTNLRSIDVYSGIGGWGLALRLANIQVVASYECWDVANETNFKNNAHKPSATDVRLLKLDDLPSKIDIVVGSPPCTQFSYSNRGGGGDIEDGLQDIIKFFTIVEHLQPKVWAMENVPRVAKIIEKELQPGGRLYRFRRLNIQSALINMAEYGLPQKRIRYIAGNFDFNLLQSYASSIPKRSLGDVIRSLATNPVRDPIYGKLIDRAELHDHIEEEKLNAEEIRINRALKTAHPIYNSMSFPDKIDRPVRTLTATCTRVCRESVVIENPAAQGTYRRLTIRERASLQGFPITFQFYGKTYAQKIQMIGNAIPPAFAYFLVQALKGVSSENLIQLHDVSEELKMPEAVSSGTEPEQSGKKFSPERKFRFAIPSLRLKSGVRFELANSFENEMAEWTVAFYFGTSKEIKSIRLDDELITFIMKNMPAPMRSKITQIYAELKQYLRTVDTTNMQRIWSHKGVGGTSPFMLLDKLDSFGLEFYYALEEYDVSAQRLVGQVILNEYDESSFSLPGLAKLAKNSPQILAGFIVGATSNLILTSESGGDTTSVRSRKHATR